MQNAAPAVQTPGEANNSAMIRWKRPQVLPVGLISRITLSFTVETLKLCQLLVAQQSSKVVPANMGATCCYLDFNFKILHKINISHESHFKFSTVLVANGYHHGQTANMFIIPERSAEVSAVLKQVPFSICNSYFSNDRRVFPILQLL